MLIAYRFPRKAVFNTAECIKSLKGSSPTFQDRLYCLVTARWWQVEVWSFSLATLSSKHDQGVHISTSSISLDSLYLISFSLGIGIALKFYLRKLVLMILINGSEIIHDKISLGIIFTVNSSLSMSSITSNVAEKQHNLG